MRMHHLSSSSLLTEKRTCPCRESCDTVGSGDLQDGESAHETIIAECHPLICNGTNGPLDSPYYAYQPSGVVRCYNMNGREVTRLNVPITTKSNLCSKAPELPSQCSWKQGMLLLGLKGAQHADLYAEAPLRYRDTIVAAQQGAGLFVRGGNPLYYTMKGTSEDVAKEVHSVLRGSLDDIGGDHLVLKVAVDENTLEPYMYVHRIPLASNLDYSDIRSGVDPIEVAYAWSLQSRRQSGGNHGWLSNLESEMRSEQKLVDELYPLLVSSDQQQQQRRWECPLLRVAFWSKVTLAFSPLIPSPVRAARLFGKEGSGRDMLRGTRSHPTQVILYTSKIQTRWCTTCTNRVEAWTPSHNSPIYV